MNYINNQLLTGLHDKPILTDVCYIANQHPKAVIIFAHGFKGFKDWGAWHIIGERFARAGFVFVKFNFSHNGTTPENPLDFDDLEAFGQNNFSIELDDLGVVIDWILQEQTLIPKEEINANQLYLIGHSRGGGAVILKANEDERVKKLITWAGVNEHLRNVSTEQAAYWKSEGVQHVFNGRTKVYMPLYYQLYENFMQNRDRLDIPKAVKNLQIPFLIAHGTDDPAVAYQIALDMHSWNPTHSRLLTLEGANHVFGTKHPWENGHELAADAEQLVQSSIDFLLE